MKTSTRKTSPSLLALSLAVLGFGMLASRADISVNLTATPLGGGINQYSYSIGNTGPDDVELVTITDAPHGDPLIGSTLIAPANFGAAYDSGVGLMFGLIDSFPELGSSALFAAGTTVGDFMFQSAAAPPDYFTAFSAITSAGETLTGSVKFHLVPAVVPDGGPGLLFASFSLLGLAFAGRKLAFA